MIAAKLAPVAALSFLITGCISLESPSGRGPDWAANMKAKSEAKRAAQQNGGVAAAPGQPGAAPEGGYITAADGPTATAGGGVVMPAAAPSTGGYSFFGKVNPGGAPDLPKRPGYDSGPRRAMIRESEAANNAAPRYDLSAPQQAVIFDKKTGYPVQGAGPTGYEVNTLPLPQGGAGTASTSFNVQHAANTPAAAPPVAMDPSEIKTGIRAGSFGRVKSPYPPYLELDSSGVLPGSLARDPATGKVFRVP